jgi:hypothetical protein
LSQFTNTSSRHKSGGVSKGNKFKLIRGFLVSKGTKENVDILFLLCKIQEYYVDVIHHEFQMHHKKLFCSLHLDIEMQFYLSQACVIV